MEIQNSFHLHTKSGHRIINICAKNKAQTVNNNPNEIYFQVFSDSILMDCILKMRYCKVTRSIRHGCVEPRSSRSLGTNRAFVGCIHQVGSPAILSTILNSRSNLGLENQQVKLYQRGSCFFQFQTLQVCSTCAGLKHLG